MVFQAWLFNCNPGAFLMNIYEKLKELGITLPPIAAPAAAYVPFVHAGNLVFLSGHIARKSGKPWVGQLGRTISTEEGKLAARSIAVELLGTLHAASGDLGRVKRIVKVMSLVNSTSDFTEDALTLITGARQRLEGNAELQRSVRHRFPYIDPLHHLQVELMRRYRAGEGGERLQRGIIFRSTGWRLGCATQAEKTGLQNPAVWTSSLVTGRWS
jgi:enamine deaminase RidA (YjgF/YER057c/UK114 family)